MLLERTLASFEPSRRVAVLTGDIQTDNDAQRLARYGFPVHQITTGGACHLDARMVTNALSEWAPDAIDLLLIENVGNLVCPTSYDLGEEARVVVLSVTEGEDKPLKYPATFNRADLVVMNKVDLLPMCRSAWIWRASTSAACSLMRRSWRFPAPRELVSTRGGSGWTAAQRTRWVVSVWISSAPNRERQRPVW